MPRGQRYDLSLLPLSPDLSLESVLWHSRKTCVAGIDEAGRGALAGPVAAGAVIFPADEKIAARLGGVRDSKQMTARQRNAWSGQIREVALAWGVGLASCQEIDALGIVPATRLAVERALDALSTPPDYLILDGTLSVARPVLQTSLIKGDCRSLSVAAASVLAKTTRDALLEQLGLEYPAYGFASHKGYGTSAHLLALEKFGPTPQHRRSFAPLREAGQTPITP